ncbi:MAG: tripartite tricarboxylate transporter substrate binding protein [Betaproteobacteria bacterium]|jgi:tripartite-type tricarboxylate transporter receptor subunit TctC|nr:tripartite tricarboxylate transporter substrate binding protein [Betaproteobacteria bacterium]
MHPESSSRSALLGAVALAATTLAAPAFAQDYPSKPVRIIVPYAPGGGLDVVGRPLAQRLAEAFGQPFLIDNRPGGGTTIGTSAAARAAPDGHTLLLTLSALAIGPSLYPSLPYDPVKDFAPVAWIGTSSYLLSVHPSVPATTVKQLLALSRAAPGRLNYSSPGIGTDPHMAAELFQNLAGVRWTHIPYGGGGPAASAVMGGQVDLTFLPTSVGTPFVKSGKLKALALSTARRSTLLPGLPTIAESGVDGFAAEAWSGILAPAGTPAPIVNRLNAAIVKAVQTVDYRNLLEERLIEPVGSTVEQFVQRLRDDVAKWRRVAREGNIKAE